MFARLLALSLAASLAFALPGAAFAQNSIPRTPDGRPDFGGVWSTPFLIPVERPDETGTKSTLIADADAERVMLAMYTQMRDPKRVDDPDGLFADLRSLARINSQLRASQVIEPEDGKLPLTEAGKARRADIMKATTARADNPESRPEFERCLAGTGRTPLRWVPAHNMRRIVQTAGHMAIYTEEGGDVRILAFNEQPRPPELTSYYGESRAQWDGDTLVIETRRIRGDTAVARTASVVTERFSLTGPDEILYQYTIEDDFLYARPWRAEFPMIRATGAVFEYYCHSANYSMVNILQAGREADKRSPLPKPAAAKPAGKP